MAKGKKMCQFLHIVVPIDLLDNVLLGFIWSKQQWLDFISKHLSLKWKQKWQARKGTVFNLHISESSPAFH